MNKDDWKDFCDKLSDVALMAVGIPLVGVFVFGVLFQFNWLWRLFPEGSFAVFFMLWLAGGVPFVLWRNHEIKKRSGRSEIGFWIAVFFIVLVILGGMAGLEPEFRRQPVNTHYDEDLPYHR